MELENLNKLYLELSQFATATTARELELLSALKEANQLLRSTHAIAVRSGEKTNWDGFAPMVRVALERQHKLLYTPLPHDAPVRESLMYRGTPNPKLPPLGDGPRKKMLIEIEVSEDFEKRLDNQWMVEREIHADRWKWRWGELPQHDHT